MLKVRINAKGLRKLIAIGGAEYALRKFRHDHTDYDHKWKDGKVDYKALVREVAIAALQLSNNDAAMVAAVAAWVKEKGAL